jgi:hypothetical protein
MLDRIEELTKERDAHKGNADANYSKWVEADAKLAKAVEVLRLYACKNECNDGRCHCSGNDCGQHASATLAEIEGEKG